MIKSKIRLGTAALLRKICSTHLGQNSLQSCCIQLDLRSRPSEQKAYTSFFNGAILAAVMTQQTLFLLLRRNESNICKQRQLPRRREDWQMRSETEGGENQPCSEPDRKSWWLQHLPGWRDMYAMAADWCQGKECSAQLRSELTRHGGMQHWLLLLQHKGLSFARTPQPLIHAMYTDDETKQKVFPPNLCLYLRWWANCVRYRAVYRKWISIPTSCTWFSFCFSVSAAAQRWQRGRGVSSL